MDRTVNLNDDILIKRKDIFNIRIDGQDIDITASKVYNPNQIKYGEMPEKYIINRNATILFWKDGTKTIIKKTSADEYNKKLAFLIAYFQKNSGLSKSQANKYLDNLKDEDEIKFAKLITKSGKVLADMCEGISNGFRNLASNFRKPEEK